MSKGETISTLINCPMSGKKHECCGCLVGEIDEKKGLIDFRCNECGCMAGYINLKPLRRKLNQELLEKTKLLIEAEENQKKRDNLTEQGEGYLNGLKTAYKIFKH